MSDQWVPKGYIDPDAHADETLTPKALPLEWGGTGLSAANLAALKNYLGIVTSGDGAPSIKPLRRLQVTDTLTSFSSLGIKPPNIETPGGALAVFTYASGRYLQLTDDSLTPLPAYIAMVDTPVQRRFDPDITFVFKVQVTINVPYGRFWVGLSNSLQLVDYDTLGAMKTATGSAARVVAFRFHGSLDAGAGTLMCSTTDANSAQEVQGAVPFTNDGYCAVRIRSIGGGTYEFYVWDTSTDVWVLEATIPTTMVAADSMFPFIGLQRTASGSPNKTLQVKMIDLIQE